MSRVVAVGTEGAEVVGVVGQRRHFLIICSAEYLFDVMDFLGWGRPALCLAVLAKWMLCKVRSPQVAPTARVQ